MIGLYDLFDYQAKLQKILNNADLPAERDDLLAQYALGIYTELGEALAINKNWKTWRKSAEYNTSEFLEEIADVWIFLINFTLAAGMNADDIIYEISRKQQILSDRLNSKEILNKNE